MIQLTDGTIVRTCAVQGGVGAYAYYNGVFPANDYPEVVLEDQLRLGDGRLAGFHFKLLDGSDWVVVRGSACTLRPKQVAEIEERLGMKRKEPELED